MICRPRRGRADRSGRARLPRGLGLDGIPGERTVCGIPLPAGLRESDRLPEPIFTPATKAEDGEHDENITFDQMIDHIAMAPGRSRSRPSSPSASAPRRSRLYRYGAAVAERRGILLADTKFEFGIGDDLAAIRRAGRAARKSRSSDRGPPAAGRMLVAARVSRRATSSSIDEVLTPDSSRFWDAATYEPGRAQASFDKQFVRDWLETQPWDKTAPGPALPDDVVAGTRARYVEAYERITGASFERYLQEDVIAP